MGEKKEIVCKYIGFGLRRDIALSIAGVTKHQYYYKSLGKRPGRKPTSTTEKLEDGQKIIKNNSFVIKKIKNIQSDPDTDYGYRKMATALVLLGYLINHKKVYRLMKESQLFKTKYNRQPKTYARYRIVTPKGPLEVIEMDIKYIWITQARRYAFILTIIDTFTRAVLHWRVGFSMKSGDVKKAWEQVIIDHLQPADILTKGVHVEIRNDNGPQFGSKIIQSFFKENYLNQVFTHPYTPQENGHVESFHNILSKSLGNNNFWDIGQLTQRLTIFYEKYNNVRLHGSIANLPPRLFWEMWDKGLIIRKEYKNRKVRFYSKIPYYQLSGNESLREVPCLNRAALDEPSDLHRKVNGPVTPKQPSVKRSPSVVPC
ncbi:DDE-type integrase/transposase/recombinase [Salinivirga cyanobacteriivorans]